MASDVEKRITAKMVLDDAGFNESLQGVNANLKLNKSALNDASVGVKAFGSSTANLQKVQNTLQSTISAAKQKVDLYKDSIDKTTQKMQDNIAKRDKLKTELDQEKTKLESATKAYGENSEVTQQCEQKVQDLTKQYDNADKAVQQNAKSVENYTTKMNNAEAQEKKYEGQLKNTNEQLAKSQSGWIKAGNGLESAGKSLKTVGKAATDLGGKLTLGVTAPLVAGAAAAIKSGADFEHQMADIRKELVASGESTSEVDSTMKEMSADSLKWSGDFGQSTDDINAGLLTLKKDGYSGKEAIDDMNTALYTARGANENLFDVINTLGGSLEAYGMKTNNAAENTKNMSHIADSFAYVANHTKASVTSLGEGFSIAGQTLSAMHQPIEVTAAAIGELASSNIDASTAADALKAGFVNLTKPTKKMSTAIKEMNLQVFDSKGQMKDLPTIIDEINAHTKNWTEQQRNAAIATVFGKESLASWNAMLNKGGDNLRQLSDGAKNSTGEVQRLSDSMKNTPVNQFKELQGSVKALGVAIGEDILPTLTPLVKEATEAVKAFGSLDDGTKKLILTTAGIAGVTGPVLVGAGKTITAISTISTTLGGLTKKIGAAKIATEAAKDAATATGAAASTAGEAVAGAGAAAGTAATATAGAGTAAAGFGTALVGALPVIGAVAAGVAAVGVGSYALYKHVTNDSIPTVDLFNKKYTESKKVIGEYGQTMDMTTTKTVNFSKATKDNVSAYVALDNNAKKTMLDMAVSSNNFTQQTKKNVVSQFTDMVNKVGGLDSNMKDKTITDFTNMVTNTSQLTTKNKDAIVQQYTQMVNKVSGLTTQQKADMIKKFTDTMTQSVGITKAGATNISGQFNQMGTKIKTGMDTQFTDRITKMKAFFAKSDALSTQDEQKILQNMTTNNAQKKAKIDQYTTQIATIYQNAASQHRGLTQQEQQQVNNIQYAMETNAVKSLSDGGIQQKVLLERIKSYGTSITREQASQIIQNANTQRDGAVKAANEQYDQTVAEIINERDNTHTISKDQADKLITEAGRQRDQSINAAQEQRKEVVDRIHKMGGETVKDLNDNTGKMLSPFEKFKQGVMDKINELQAWMRNHPIVAALTAGVTGQPISNIVGHNATGTNDFQGGLTTLHEQGYEVYSLPRGTKIYNHDASEDLVLKTAQAVAQSVVNNMPKSSTDNGIAFQFEHVTINGYSDLKKLMRDAYNIQQDYALAKGGK